MIARILARAAILACLLSPARALAETPFVFLAPVSAAGSTEGKAAFKLGVGAAASLGDRVDLGITLNGAAAVDGGLATLLSYAPDASKPDVIATWDLGVSASLSVLGEKKKRERPIAPSACDKRTDPSYFCALYAAYDACSQKCGDNPDDKFCKSRGRVLLQRGAVAEMLDRKVGAFVDKATARDEPAAPPPLDLSSFCVDQKRAARDAYKTYLADRADASLRAEARTSLKKSIKDAYSACAAACVDRSDPFCDSTDEGAPAGAGGARPKPIRAELTFLYAQYDEASLCEGAKPMLQQHYNRVGRDLFPVAIVNAGFKYGWQQQRYRAASGALLIEHTDLLHPWSAGANAVYLPRLGPVSASFEFMGLVSKTVAPAAKTVRWCRTAGAVPDDDKVPRGSSTPAETCQEAPLGAPAQSTRLAFTLRTGLWDAVNGNFRLAIGPDVTIEVTDQGATRWADASLRIPLYAAFKPVATAQYNGILRLTPSVTSMRVDGGPNAVKVTLELALLGQRYLFSDRFDQL